ncbi:mitochondrial ornithine transporter 1-like [Mya arenaria]|uniref:mitochondrial ornithine transporter 1-like n=1 Tax=Mya arenaria TaxID=6604 RepID=UPI0022E62186|nr:mitochondrial ornithine transporter 1-like [Mya arenaria]XP_052796056.1 mitochondrial ornithine transporter 1-like [Mya arenaria]
MSRTSGTTPVLVVETVPLGEALPMSERTVTNRNPALDGVIDFIGGTTGATASVYVGQSLDTVKVKMQTFPTLYKNALDCFAKTYRQDGIARGLYAGTVPALAANISENSVLFMFYGLCQKIMTKVVGKEHVTHLNPLENALSGGTAAFFSSFTLCPTELVKCRLQAMREMASLGKLEGGLERLKIGPFGLTKEILQQEGIRGLFKGLTATFMREIPGYVFFFGGYEATRHLLTPAGKTKDEIGAFRTVLSGGVGGVCLWVTIFPADVVKSRVQVASTAGMLEPTFRSVIKQIYKEEGIQALYKGLGPTVLRTFPATGALFLAYETTKKWLGYAADTYT